MQAPDSRSADRASSTESRAAVRERRIELSWGSSDPVSPWPGPTRCSGAPKRRRQERTVYTTEQLKVLEEHFRKNEYPGYQDREVLAARLNLQEHKVQVWFKNRRAKRSRLKRLSQARGLGPGNAHTGHGAPGSPALPEGPGVCSPSPPSPARMLPAPEPSVSGHGPARWALAQMGPAQEDVPAAPGPVPAPAPGWPDDPYASDFWPEPVVIFNFTDLFPTQDPSQRPPSPLFSEYQKDSDSADENDSAFRQFLDL
ncbi:tetrapeptide repeat homeobox protein 2-like [Camelus bactrianus]|uniref:Tetrapeptide repeat homeobox protein 2-like n=1 Tax=Camelus bactrianus TaxID=9837 RepID=A0AC58QXC7_CAMBA